METFVIVNPGQGVNATFSGFCNFLYGYERWPVALNRWQPILQTT